MRESHGVLPRGSSQTKTNNMRKEIKTIVENFDKFQLYDGQDTFAAYGRERRAEDLKRILTQFASA
jgi:hypothetical protein